MSSILISAFKKFEQSDGALLRILLLTEKKYVTEKSKVLEQHDISEMCRYRDINMCNIDILKILR